MKMLQRNYACMTQDNMFGGKWQETKMFNTYIYISNIIEKYNE